MNRGRNFKFCQVKTIKGKGLGVFANRDFKTGEVVVIGRIIRKVRQRTNYSFQIDWNVHVDLDEPARLLNHSCEPNCGLRKNIFGGYDFVAMRKIKSGEELCWDYCMSEYKSIAVKQCRCGSKHCRGKIKGWKYLPKRVKRQYKGFATSYLLGRGE